MILNRHPDLLECSRGVLMTPGLKYIGYWTDNQDPEESYYVQKQGLLLPWPGDYVDLEWDARERDRVISYLESAPFPPNTEWWCGESHCRLCSKYLGFRDRIDGTYVWPEDFEHYLKEHGVRPSEEFVLHTLGGVS